ncbi:hypothetical protein [Micrococcus luteus]|uniref:hypothetical protein n=1 Tax=Micrococcus luteus TaxID=1270 RepID=UPI00387A5257
MLEPWSDYSMTFWTTAGTLITGGATVGLLLGAVAAWHTAKATLEQMQRDSRSQTRPYLSAELAPSIAGSPAWDLVIRNTGRSSARSVYGTLDATPEGPYDPVVWSVRNELAAERTIVPGSSLRLFWFLGDREKGMTVDSAIGFAAERVLSLSYRDEEGNQYTDQFPLRVDGSTPAPSKGPLSRNAGPMERRLSDIVGAIGSLRLER